MKKLIITFVLIGIIVCKEEMEEEITIDTYHPNGIKEKDTPKKNKKIPKDTLRKEKDIFQYKPKKRERTNQKKRRKRTHTKRRRRRFEMPQFPSFDSFFERPVMSRFPSFGSSKGLIDSFYPSFQKNKRLIDKLDNMIDVFPRKYDHFRRRNSLGKMYEAKDSYEIEILVPGIKKDEINIEANRDYLAIRIQTETMQKELTYKIDGNMVDIKGIIAKHDLGLLKISIPKKEMKKSPLKIEIN